MLVLAIVMLGIVPLTPAAALGAVVLGLVAAFFTMVIRDTQRDLACPHDRAVIVGDLCGELVAWLCQDCDKQLPWDFKEPATAGHQS
jgi:hypothetical protein